MHPVLSVPGYSIKSIDERSPVYFADNPKHLVEAWADNGDGVGRAGFAIQVHRSALLYHCSTHNLLQGLSGLLIRKIEGNYNNVVGFPAASFFPLLDLLVEEEADFLDV